MKTIIRKNNKLSILLNKLFNQKNLVFITAAALFFVSVILFSEEIIKPYTFNSGDIISSSQMNQNFDTVYYKSNELDARIELIEKNGNGWSPVLAIHADGERLVLKLEDWAGGTGEKPQIDPAICYLGETGLAALSSATDIRGLQGEQGLQGPQGEQGITGDTGLSAYQVWLNSGNSGTEAEFLASLKGDKGETGDTGPQGIPGPAGTSPDAFALVQQELRVSKNLITSDKFMKLTIDSNEIEGDCTITSFDREGDISLYATSFGINQPYEAGSSYTTSAIKYTTFMIEKGIDKATPHIYNAFIFNKTVDEVLIRYFRPAPSGSGAEEHYLTIKLQQGSVVQVEQHNSFDCKEREFVAFSFDRIEITYENAGITGLDMSTLTHIDTAGENEMIISYINNSQSKKYMELYANENHIKGETTLSGREDTIEVDVASLGTLPLGQNAFSSLVLEKKIDKATPLLFKAMIENASCNLWLRHYRPDPGGSGLEQQYLTYHIEQAKIVRFEHMTPFAGLQGAGNRELVEIIFGKISIIDEINNETAIWTGASGSS